MKTPGPLDPTDLPSAEQALAGTVSAQHPQVRADLERLVRIRSVSADPQHAGDVRASAAAIVELARDAGAGRAEVLSVPDGRPAVVARWPAPKGMPTVLLYAHHDVQPAAPGSGWSSDPFDPVERDGRVYGRGIADDKAGVMAHLAALRAHDGSPPVGVTLFVEGEEEVGSPTFAAFLAEHAELLAADVIVVADSLNWRPDVPALTASLRGVVTCEVEVRTLARAVHSGVFGGAVPDALTTLSRLIATLHRRSGQVAVAGLVSRDTAAVDYPMDAMRTEAGVLDGVEMIGAGDLAARVWYQPSISVLGIDAPSIADSSAVLVPSAKAYLSMRVAPGDDAGRALGHLRQHLHAHAPWGAEVTVTDGAVGPATDLPTDTEVGQLARGALADAFGGVDPVILGVGGSIPFIAMLAERYPGAEVLVTGLGDSESNWHGPDESLSLGTFERCCFFEALLLRRLAAARD